MPNGGSSYAEVTLKPAGLPDLVHEQGSALAMAAVEEGQALLALPEGPLVHIIKLAGGQQ